MEKQITEMVFYSPACIKQRRKAMGFKVGELASMAGIPASTLYGLESGRIENPTIDTLKPLGDALKVTFFI